MGKQRKDIPDGARRVHRGHCGVEVHGVFSEQRGLARCKACDVCCWVRGHEADILGWGVADVIKSA